MRMVDIIEKNAMVNHYQKKKLNFYQRLHEWGYSRLSGIEFSYGYLFQDMNDEEKINYGNG